MKQITILIAVLVLTFAESYSADLTQKKDLSDYNQYAFLLSTDGDFSYISNYVDISNRIEESAPENVVDNNNLNEKSVQSEKVTELIEEDSDDELFDRSAGAMGIGIF
jgi:hypothetical protein